ncbi:MAG: N-acetylneuraminate synthase family protein, partial [Bdellovibrionales bacterium]|nr:N-acetylneuraminate synthase family protein [Bdellovibrionales bacterium]
VGFLSKNSVRFALMHCVSCYPVDTQNAHLENVKHLAARYRCPVGYSGHDIGTSLSLVAVSLGACIIEKHFTLDRSMEGPDHRVSLLPEEFQRLAASLRTHKANGKRLFSKKPRRKEALLQGEQLNKQLFRKSVVAARPIRMGQIIGQDDLMLRCPGTGLSGQALGQLFGTPAAKDYSTEEIFFEIAPTLARSREEETFFEWGHGGLVVRYHDFETALSFSPRVLEFHLTYADTEREIPLEKFERFRDRLNGLKLRVHCCEYLGEQLFDLCTGYREVYKRSLRTLERVIEITHQLNRFFLDESPMIVFNCGAMTLKEDVRQVAIDRARFLRDLQHLSNHGIELLAQTMPPSPWYFGGQWKGHFLIDPQELRWYAQETGNGVCLDLSHAAMAAEYLNIPFLEYCQSLKPFVKHIHLSDARGIEDEGLQIGDGSIPFPQFFSEFQSFSGSWIPEIWQGHVNNHFAARVALKRLSESYLAGCKPENRIALLGNE